VAIILSPFLLLVLVFSIPLPKIGKEHKCHLEEYLFPPNISSSCPQSWRHGPHQHVVAFVFYGDQTSPHMVAKQYWLGLKRNLEAIPNILGAKWRVRLYHDLREDNPLLDELCVISKAHPILDLCPVSTICFPDNASSIFPMLWRFFPTLDFQVTTVLPRDLDSLPSAREAAALGEWIKSNYSFHVMRDHPHHGVPMLGGLWGWRTTVRSARPDWSSVWKRLLRDPLARAPRTEWGQDQTLLRRYIWRWAKWDCLTHDAFHCSKFSRTKPFPTRREIHPNNFVGAVTSINSTLEVPCPSKCRPAAHKDWTFC